MSFFSELEKINQRPRPFEFYTAKELWADEHTSAQMLEYHLNERVDLSSRNKQFIGRSAGWIAEHFKVEAGSKVADFGCGPGLYAHALAGQGAQVTGIDFSPRSIEYARAAADKAGLPINYVNQDYLEFETSERFDLVIMIMCDFCALSPAQREKLLTKFHSILAPGGSVLLDVYSLKAFERREEAALYQENQLDGFWSASKYYGFVNTFKYNDEKVVLDKYTLYEADRTRVVYNWLQHFSPETLEKEFADCGLSAQELFANVAGDPFDPQADEFAILAQKVRG